MSIESLAERVCAQAKEERLAKEYALWEAGFIDSALFSLSAEIGTVIGNARVRFNAGLREFPSKMIDKPAQLGLYGLRLSRTQSFPPVEVEIVIERGRYSVEVSAVKNSQPLPRVRYALKMQDKWPCLHDGKEFVTIPTFAERLIEYFV